MDCRLRGAFRWGGRPLFLFSAGCGPGRGATGGFPAHGCVRGKHLGVIVYRPAAGGLVACVGSNRRPLKLRFRMVVSPPRPVCPNGAAQRRPDCAAPWGNAVTDSLPGKMGGFLVPRRRRAIRDDQKHGWRRETTGMRPHGCRSPHNPQLRGTHSLALCACSFLSVPGGSLETSGPSKNPSRRYPMGRIPTTGFD